MTPRSAYMHTIVLMYLTQQLQNVERWSFGTDYHFTCCRNQLKENAAVPRVCAHDDSTATDIKLLRRIGSRRVAIKSITLIISV